jgi:hypothetical protein
MRSIDCKIVFRIYSFEEVKPHCHKCEKSRWQIVANYDVIYFPGDPEACITSTPLKVVVGGYKNLKDAKKALFKGRIRKRDVVFDTSEL